MAVETTTKQMALTRDTGPGGFMERVIAQILNVAGDVLKEFAGEPYHAQRASYAQRVVNGPQIAATNGGPLIVMHTAIADATTYDETTKTSVCTAPDHFVETAIKECWNGLAGIDTPSTTPPAA